MRNSDYHEGYLAALQDCYRAAKTIAANMPKEQQDVAFGLADAFQALANEIGEPARIILPN
jgi:hypothetical protein